MKRFKKRLAAVVLGLALLVGLPGSIQKIDATTEFFGEIDDAWMNSRHGSIIKMSDGTLYASGWNRRGELGLGGTDNSDNKFSRVIFHKPFYGTNREIIDYSHSYFNGFLLDNTGSVYTSSDTSTNDQNNGAITGAINSYVRHPADIDSGSISGRTLSGNPSNNTGGVFVLNQVTEEWKQTHSAKIVRIGTMGWSFVFLDSDNTLWGVGSSVNNTYGANALGLNGGHTDQGKGNNVKKIAENVEDFKTGFFDLENIAFSTNLWFKVNGKWYATGNSHSNKSATGVTGDYITQAQFNNPNTVDGNAGIGREVDLTSLNSAYGTSYTHSDIKTIEGYARSTMILMNDGTAYHVGVSEYDNIENAAGTGSANTTVPRKVTFKASQAYIDEIGPGWDKVVRTFRGAHAIFLETESGRIWARGSNDNGDLGFRTNPVSVNTYLMTDVSDPARTGMLRPANTYGGKEQKTPLTIMNPRKLIAAWDGSFVLLNNGYVAGTATTTRFYGSTQFEDNLNGYGFVRVKREYRVVRNPQIIVDGNNQPESWKVNPEDMKIGQATEWADKNAGTYPTYAQFEIYGCGTSSGVYTSKDESKCTYKVSTGTNQIGTGAGTAYSTAHEANRIDDDNLYNIDIPSLGLDAGYYKIITKRYAFIGPNGTGLNGVNQGTLQYNESGTDKEYYFEFKIDPVINSEDYVEVDLDSTYNPETGVTGKDSKNQDVNFGSGEFDLKSTTNVDTSKVGVYTTTYTMKDSHDTSITTTKTTKVLVKDKNTIIDKEKGYMIDAKDYRLTQGIDVILGTDAEILTKSDAKGWLLEDGQSTEVVVSDNGGYKNEIGGYNFEIAIKAEPSVTTKGVASIVDEDTVIVDDYALSAKDFYILKKDVTGNGDITDAKYGAAKAWHISDASKTVTLNVVDNGGYKADKGTYTINLNITEKPAAAKSIKAKVYDNDNIVIGDEYVIVSDDVTMGKDAAKEVTSDDDLIEITKAKAYKKSDDSEATVKVDTANTNFASTPGEYKATFYVEAESTTKIESKIKVLDYDIVVIGEKYILVANHFTIKRSEAAGMNEASIVSESGAKAWLIDDENTAGTPKITANTIQDSNGDYDIELYVQQESTTKATIVATVAGGYPPVLTVSSPVEIQVGDEFDEKAGVSVTDEDPLTADDVTVSGFYDVDVAGVYVLTYSVEDSDFNTDTKTRVLVVNDGSFVIGNKYILRAADFVINMPDVKTTEAEILKETKAEAYLKADGSEAEATVVSDGNYAAKKGVYTINVGVKEETTTNKNVKATVLDKDEIVKGATYSIAAKSTTTGKDNVRDISDENLIKLIQAEAWLNTDYSTKGTVEIVDKGSLKAEAGSYLIRIRVAEEPAVITTATVTVIDSDIVVEGEEYFIAANHVYLGKKDAAGVAKTDLADKAKATAWKKSNSAAGNVKLDDSSYVAAPGNYDATFSVIEEPTTKAKVNVVVYDKDHVGVGSEYAIGANDFTINSTTAATITNSDIVTKSAADAWQKANPTTKGTPSVASGTVGTAEGTYEITLKVDEESSTTVKIIVTVSDGLAPELNVTSPIEISVGDEFVEKAGVTVSDDKDPLTVDDVTITGTYDVDVAGIYVLTYSVSDTDHNIVEKTRVLIVNDGTYVIGDKYILKAESFVINKTDVSLASEDIINAAGAKAYLKADGSEAQVLIKNTGGYAAAKGTYNIMFAPANETATEKQIKATVLDKDIIVKGDKYSIAADNIILGKKDAKNISDANLIAAAKAEAWLNKDYDTKGKVEVEDKSQITGLPGNFKVTFNVDEEPATKVTVDVKVLDSDYVVIGENYYITANDVYLGKKDAQEITNNDEFITLANAQAFKKEDDSVATPKVGTVNFTPSAGDHSVEFYVMEEAATKVPVTVKVLDEDRVEVGTNYIIAANDFSITVSKAATITNSEIKTLSGVIAYVKETMEVASGTPGIANNKIEENVGVYDVTFEVSQEPATKVTIKASVTSGVAPEMTVSSPIEIGVGDSFDEKAGVTVLDTDQPELGVNDVVVTGTYDTDKEGIYVLNYKVTDKDGNYDEKTRILVVNDGNIVIGTEYILEAHDFVINKKDVTASTVDIKTRAQAKAYKIEDGSVAGVDITGDGGYKAQKGEYTITFAVAQEVATTKAVKATVLDKDVIVVGDQYSIGAKSVTIGKADVEGIDNQGIIDLIEGEAWLNKDYNTKGTVKIDNDGGLEAAAGTYTVNISVTEEPATKTSAKVTVIDEDKYAEGEEYSIAANNIVMGMEEAKALSNNSTFITLAKARSWKTDEVGTSGTVQVVSIGGFKAEAGTYDITFRVQEETSTQVTITAEVLADDHASSGDKYAISGNDFTINSSEAMTIDEAGIISNSSAKAWVKDNKATAGTVKMTANTVGVLPGDYFVELYVNEESTTKITIKVTVSNGLAPTLNVTSPIEIEVGDSFDEKAGITVSDDKDTLTVDDVTMTGTYDINTEGVYTLKYSVTDSDDNTVEKTRLLVVNDGNIIVGAKYIIIARDFTVNKPSVDTSDAKVIEFARAEARKVEDGSVANVDIDSLGGYKAEEGTYTITFSVREEPATTKAIKATVLDKGVVVPGDVYDIGANHATVGKGDAKALISDDSKLIDITKAEAWQKDKYELKGTVEVEDKSKLKAAVGAYEVTFNVAEEPETKVTVTITVVDKIVVVEGEEYAIGADNIVLGKKDAEAITNNNSLIGLAKAESWKKATPGTAAGTVKLLDTDFQATEGTYYVEFNVEEEPATKVRVSVTVRAEDHADIGDNYMIVGNDFTINTATAGTIDEAGIISNAAAKAWLIENEATAGTVKITSNTITTTPGTYDVELYVDQEPDTKIIIKVTVSDGLAPELEVTSPVVIGIGGSFNEKAGITVSDDKDPLTADDVTMTGTYNVNKEGVYVLTYSVSDSDGNPATAKRLLVVDDGHIHIGDNYVLEAYDFVIEKAEVNTADNKVIEEAKAKAYKIEDATAGTVNVIDLGGYEAAKGEYNIKFNVAEETDVEATIKANVLDKTITNGDSYSIAAGDITVGKIDAQSFIDDDAKLIAATGAESWKNEDYTAKSPVVVSDKTNLATTKGTYTVEFAREDDSTLTVEAKITVTDKGIVVPGEKYDIGGNHITVGKEQAAEFIADDAKLITAADVEAWKKGDLNDKATVIVSDKTNLKAEKGTYNVEYAVDEERETKIILKVTVEDKSIVVEGNQYNIGANHITIGKADAKEMIADDAVLISATDAEAWEKDDYTTKGTVKVTDKAALEATDGVYEVTFNVDEEPATQVTVKITVFDKDVVAPGDAYDIGANHITIGKADALELIADDAKLISATDAEAWEKDNYANKATVEVEDKSELKATDGTYNVTFRVGEETATKVTIKVTVRDKDVIVPGVKYDIGANHITVGKEQAAEMIADDATLISATDAEAWEKENSAIKGTVVVEDKSELKTTDGIYNVTFKVSEEEATKVTVKITVYDKDVIVEGTAYDIGANHVTVGKEQAAEMIADDAVLISATDAEAWEKENYSAKATVAVEDKSALKATNGTYEVTFKVSEEEATQVTVKITVFDKDVITPGVAYDIGANHVTVGKEQAAEMIADDATLISATDAEAWTKGNYATKGTVEVEDKSNLKTADGVYEVTFKVSEEEATKVTVKITVFDKDVVVEGEDYNIGANHITVGKADAKAMIADDATLISATDAEAWLKDDYATKGTVEVSDKSKLKAVDGVYEVTFRVAEESDTRVTVMVTVFDKDVVVEGENYDIGANHITIGKADAQEMIDMDSRLITATDAEAWLKDDYATKGTVQVDDKSELKAVKGDYEVTFKVKEEEATKVTVKVTVIDKSIVVEGKNYSIGANNITVGKEQATEMINNNAKLIELTDAEAWVKGDYETKANVQVNDKSNLKATEGVYEVTFNVREETGTKVTIKVTVIDKIVVVEGEEYDIGANHITIGKADAKEMIADDATLITATDTEAWEKGNFANKVAVEVEDKSALKAVDGDYEVTFRVKDEPATKVTVTVTVIDKDVVVQGDKYNIGANHITIGKQQVEAMIADDIELMDATAAEAWLKEDYSTKGIVQVEDKSALKTTAGEYEVTFNVRQEPATKVTVTVTVTDNDVVTEGEEYSIGANNITVTKADAQGLIDDDAKLIAATAAEAWEKENLANKATVEVEDKSALKTADGTYEVTFRVAEEPATKVTVKVTVVDKGIIVPGVKYDIGANNVTVGITQAKAMIASDTTLIGATDAEAWEKGNYAAKGTVEVEDKTALKATGGTYDVVFNVAEEPATKVTVTVTVIEIPIVVEGDAYDIGAGNATVGIEDAKALIANDDKLIEVTGAQAWLKDDFDTKGTVQVEDKSALKAVVGTYEVTFNVAEEPDTKITVTIEVQDYSIIVPGETYYIGANNIVIGKDQAAAMLADDNELITEAGAQAWLKENPETKGTVEVEDKSALNATTAGEYEVTFRVGEEPETKATITVEVKDYSIVIPGDNYYIGADNIIVGTADAQDMIDSDDLLIGKTNATAWLKEDSDNEGTVKVVDKSELKAEEGIYEVEFSVEEDPSVKIKVKIEVRPEGRVIIGEKYMIVGYDFEVDTYTAATISENDIFKLTKVKAWLIEDKDVEGTVKLKENTVVGKGKGVYNVQFYIEEEEETTLDVKAKVVEQAKGSIIIINSNKKASNEYIEGSNFRIEDKDGNVVKDNLITDYTGAVIIKGLADGEYNIVQVSVNDAYFINKKARKVIMVNGSTVKVMFTNEEK